MTDTNLSVISTDPFQNSSHYIALEFDGRLDCIAAESQTPATSEFPHKGQWHGALMFSLICTWMEDWVNNREAGDLGRHRAHYDVIIMSNHHIALEFDRRKSKACQIIKLIGTILNKNIAVSRLHKILR